jgi:hypothetical protein
LPKGHKILCVSKHKEAEIWLMVCESIECKNKESEEQNEGINTKLFLDLLLVEAKENFV